MAKLCAAGVILFRQIDREWPERGHASDGWFNSSPTSDHSPQPPDGFSRATDVDASLTGPDTWNSTAASWKLAQQLRHAMVNGEKRLAYIIAWNPEKKADFICSMNPEYQPLGEWRPYTGESHQNHLHISFTARGDYDGSRFKLPIFREDAVTEAEEKAIVERLLKTRVFGDDAPKEDRDVTVRDVYRKIWRDSK